MRRSRAQALAVSNMAVLIVTFAAGSASAVTSAAEVCSPTVDPCLISSTVIVDDGATLDFGIRAVEVIGAGKLDFGASAAILLCGDFTINVGAATGIKVKNATATQGGRATIRARRACSGDGTTACLNDVSCAAAGLGLCSIGNGDVFIDGKILGDAEFPAAVDIMAAGEVTFVNTINLDGTIADADGGDLTATAVAGSVNLNGKILATGGMFSAGGNVSVSAGLDIFVNNTIGVTGGDLDGGIIELSANRDVSVGQDISADSVAGEGFGGEILVFAGRNLVIAGGTAGNTLLLSTDGNGSIGGVGGDGGAQIYETGGNLSVGQFVKLRSNGASPDGFGEGVTLDAGGDLVFQGQIESRGLGGQGGGGLIDFVTQGDLSVTSSAVIDVSGGAGGGGDVDIFSSGEFFFDGSIDSGASGGGIAGSITARAAGNATITGTLTTSGASLGAAAGTIELDACELRLAATAVVNNAGVFGNNKLVGHGSVTTAAGSQLLADASTGANTVTYRDVVTPPVLDGVATPSPAVQLDPVLAPCALCGNGTVNGGESCDDGNLLDGDGCSSTCQDEGCIADTPGYPAGGLCADGDGCTVDSCDTVSHSCTHVLSCDDGISCTADSCVGISCVHAPDDLVCGDGNPCTADLCNEILGCTNDNLADGSACDDGAACTVDSCTSGVCVGVPDDLLCDDGDGCTVDSCDPGTLTCSHILGCDDGVSCTADSCVAGTCVNAPSDLLCDDGNDCTSEVCDPVADCGFASVGDGSPCNPETDFCAISGQCSTGSCIASDSSFMSNTKLKVSLKPGAGNDKMNLKAFLPLSDFASLPSDTGLLVRVNDDASNEVYSGVIPAVSFVNVRDKNVTFKFKDKVGTIANGITIALVKIIARKGVAKAKVKTVGVEIPGAAGQGRISANLLFGVTPAGSDCLTTPALTCKVKPKAIRCKGP
ncbi:MAG: DUF4215 domain-containing protein [Candidatus Binatia bacterium]